MNETNKSKLMPIPLPVSPAVFNTIGGTMTVLFIMALIENVTVLIVYKNNNKLRNKTNIWIISVVICDLLIVLNAFPIVIASSFARVYILGEKGCNYDGFVVTFLGCSSIFLLTGLSVHRYIIMLKKSKSKLFTRMKVLLSVLLCCVFGLIWGIVPFIGWGSFAQEGIGISCAPNWRSDLPSDRTYMVAMYIFVLFLPIVIIGYCYCMIVSKIWREKQNHSAWFQQRSVKRDIQVTISVAFTILSFIISWMPYAVVSLLEGFFHIDIMTVSPMLVQLPCLMAKTACIWNPIVYVSHNSRYRQAYLQTFRCCRIFCKRNGMENDKNTLSDSKELSLLNKPTQTEHPNENSFNI